MQKWFVIIFVLASCTNRQESVKQWIATAPAGDQYTQINREGTTVIPNGRLITPAGKQIMVAPHPFGLTISPDGNTIITSNSGTGPFSISIIKNYKDQSPMVRQIPDSKYDADDDDDEEEDEDDEEEEEALLKGVFMGLAISPDGSNVYVAGGQQNKIFVFDLNTYKKSGEINCNKSFDGTDYSDGYIGDMVLNKDGSRLYAVDQIGFRMMVMDTKTNQVIQNVKTGRYPFGINLVSG